MGSTLFTIFIIFLILKLTNVIDWSWWWVTSPLWVSVLIVPVLILLLIFGVLSSATILAVLAKWFFFRTRR
ncbi:MAG: hypothetical protein WC333_02715 [Dehalococcoidia bacterium]|jgi:hypothetical protein